MTARRAGPGRPPDHHRGPAVQDNGYGRLGKFLTTNVDLWPRPIVLFANRASFDALSSNQQDILRRAITDIVPAETARERRAERDAASFLCRAGEQFISASPQDLAALRRAVQPVYDALRRDPRTDADLAQIEKLRAATSPSSDRLTCVNSASSPTRPSPIDGVYRMTTTMKRDSKTDPDPVPENYGTWTYVFTHGRFAITQEDREACTWGYGTFVVNGTHFAWTFTDGGGIAPNGAVNKPGEFFIFGWSLYRDTLTLTPVKGAVSPSNFRLKPWRQLSTTPTRRYFSTRCLRPRLRSRANERATNPRPRSLATALTQRAPRRQTTTDLADPLAKCGGPDTNNCASGSLVARNRWPVDAHSAPLCATARMGPSLKGCWPAVHLVALPPGYSCRTGSHPRAERSGMPWPARSRLVP